MIAIFSKLKKALPGKKKKKGEAANPKQDSQMLQGTSSNKILIRVYKNFGSNTSFLKAEYEAEERRDIYKNLISVNKQYSHNEDTDFTMDDVYREMEIVLEFKNYDKDGKIKLLDKKITKQENIVLYLKKFPELNCMYNYADEALKLKDYNLLRNYIKNHDGAGAYFSIEKGRRVYSFESIDGFLVPIWRGVDSYTQYPDHTRKLKITIQEDQRMREEMKAFLRDKTVHTVVIWAIICAIVLFALNIYSGFLLYDKHANIDEKIHASSYSCAEYTSQVNQKLIQIMDNAVIRNLLDATLEREAEEKEPEIEQKEISLDPKDLIPIIE